MDHGVSAAERTHELMLRCLYEVPPEDPTEAVVVEGLTMTVGFDPRRIEKNKAKIETLISEVVPDVFYRDGGGGMSFLNFCIDRNGEHWAEHPTMQELYLLAAAIGRARFCLPREFWSALPGGVPYIQFDREVSLTTSATVLS